MRNKAAAAAGFVLCLAAGVGAGLVLDEPEGGTLAGLVAGLWVERYCRKERNTRNK